MIETLGLTKRFGSLTAVDALDLRVEPGEVFGFLGPNGAGKSTTIRLLLDLIRPSSGSARIFGLDCRADAAAIHRRVGLVPSEVAMPRDLIATQYLAFRDDLRGIDTTHTRAQLAERLDADLTRRLGEMSTGNRQKVALIQAVAISAASSGLPVAESSGRMTMLATSSVTRRAIAVGAALSILGAVSAVVGVYWVTTVIGSSIGDLDIAVARLTAAAASLWLLGLAVGAIAFCLGGATGARGPTIGVASTVAVGSFLTYGLLPLSERFAWGRRISLWYPFADHEPLTRGFDVSNALILVGVVVLGLAGGLHLFERRDLG